MAQGRSNDISRITQEDEPSSLLPPHKQIEAKTNDPISVSKETQQRRRQVVTRSGYLLIVMAILMVVSQIQSSSRSVSRITMARSSSAINYINAPVAALETEQEVPHPSSLNNNVVKTELRPFLSVLPSCKDTSVSHEDFLFLNMTYTGPRIQSEYRRCNKVKKNSNDAAETTLIINQTVVVGQERSRIAYLVSVDETSPRTIRSTNLLSKMGFQVVLQCAPRMEDKVLSNKLAQLAIYRKIIADEKRPWGYIFEDDIMLSDSNVNFTVETDLVGGANLESKDSLYLYLGICAPKQLRRDRYCGKCAHAYGISREGARELLEYNELAVTLSEDPRYMDVVMISWCTHCHGGFPVGRIDLRSKQESDHNGILVQDRQKFPSLIDQS